MSNPYYEKLIGVALRFVSFRPRSEKELRDFLLKKPNHEDLDKVMERMRELGYVDDRKFADWWISQRSDFRPKGKRALVYELRKKGVTVDVTVDEYPLAKKAMRKKPKDVFSYLFSRGFSRGTIERIIDEQREKD